ncbi:MAG: CoA-binding protein [Chromatiales bacterium]|jgi:predicted CoA-binding protein
MNPQDHHVVVLGASPKPGRYANMAVKLLKEKGYRITPVHPKFAEIEQLPVINRLEDIDETVHTLTLYVGTERLADMIDDIIALQPARVIFNPGTESAALQQALDQHHIEWLEACTLVMLKTKVF